MGRQTKSNSKVLDLVLGEDSFPPVIPQIMLTTKFLVYNCVARELFVRNSSIQCHAETGNTIAPLYDGIRSERQRHSRARVGGWVVDTANASWRVPAEQVVCGQERCGASEYCSDGC